MTWQNRIPTWAAVAIAAVLLFTIGSAAHSAGWSQGYTLGLLAGSATDGSALTPYLLSRGAPGMAGGFGFIGGFFGVLFRLAFFVFLIALAAKFFGFWRWRMRSRHGLEGHNGHWGRHAPWGEQGPQPQTRPEQPQQAQAGGASPGSEQPAGYKPQPTHWTNV
jgi:hypothetical protein